VLIPCRGTHARLKCPDGESTLSVNIAENVVANESSTLYFECDDLDAKVTELKRLGLKFDEDPTDRPWLWRQAYLKDPNRNKICLFYAGENRKNPLWRLSEPPAAAAGGPQRGRELTLQRVHLS